MVLFIHHVENYTTWNFLISASLNIVFQMVTPPAKRDVRRSLKSTSLGMAAKYRLSSNSSVPSSTSSGKQPPNKVTRIRKAEIDLQVQREMEQIRIEEERKQKEELLQKQKQKIKIEDVEDYDFDGMIIHISFIVTLVIIEARKQISYKSLRFWNTCYIAKPCFYCIL